MNESSIPKKYLSAAIFVAAIVLMIIITVLLAKPVAGLADHPEELREVVRENGFLGVAGFLCLLILQVFAAIVPGGPFEIAAGYAFGLLPGAIICDIGTSVGGLLVFLLTGISGCPL